MKNSTLYRRKWLIQAPLGLILIGAGACLLVEASLWKFQGFSFWEWFLGGTLALAFINGGLSVFGDAIVQRIKYERSLEIEESA